jgi:hypothetical protein
VAAPALLAAGFWAGMGNAGGPTRAADILGLTARLAASQEVPKPVRVAAGARGGFTGRLERGATGATLSWRLTFGGLSGRAAAAHVHRGVRGRAGPIVLALCGPCRSGASGTAKVSARTVAALLGGGAYVNVHTARNPAGEIRGQIGRTVKPPPPTSTTTVTTSTTATTETVVTTY